MHSHNALKQKNMDYLNYSLSIYTLVDPDNADAHFYSACYASLSGNVVRALLELDKAISLGYTNKEELQNPDYFPNLQENGKYWELVNSVGNP